MRRLSTILIFGFVATFFVQQQLLAQAQKPKPEDVLRKMSDYLGKLPAFLAASWVRSTSSPRARIPCKRSRR